MSSADVAPREGMSAIKREPVVNDFSIQVATVNGSGSQTANAILLRSIFQMGVPVSGKNLFPSNIAGLPTWFTIRASKHAYVARKKEIDFLVSVNPETAQNDVNSLAPGSAVLYDEPLQLSELRNDLAFYSVPLDKLVAAACSEARLRKHVKNLIYVGAMANLLGLDLAEVESAIRKQFSNKPKAAELNWNAARAGYDYAATQLPKHDPFRIERMNGTAGKIIIDGNRAAALGAMFAGVTVVPWYPITPSSSLIEDLTDYLKEYRVGPDGKATFAVVQAEDELAAIGMVLGASWAGARAMTATSGPGLSLMAEFTGFGYYTDIPAVVWDVQRVGPSTGLPTRTSQADLISTAFMSHGDTRHVLLFPSSVSECFDFAGEAFDLAEYLQTPVFVMSDLDLGMNNWMSDPFEYPEKPLNRGKVLTKEDLDRLGSFARYKDVDGDGIGYRTLPGTDHPAAAYFTRGSGHNEQARYSEKPEDYVKNIDRLTRKLNTARALAPQPEIQDAGNEVAILAYGTSHWACVETIDQLQQEHGIKADYLRVRAFPFSSEVHEFVARHQRVYVVDQNRDGQMAQLLKIDLPAADAVRLRNVLHYNGLPIDARSVTDAIAAQEEK